MKYGLVIINIACCIIYALMAVENSSVIYAICSVLWGVCAVINYITYIHRNKKEK